MAGTNEFIKLLFFPQLIFIFPELSIMVGSNKIDFLGNVNSDG